MTLPHGGPSRLTLRRFQVLLNALPPESRYQTVLRNSLPPESLEDIAVDHDPSKDRWSKAEVLAAGQHDLMQLLLIAVISGLGGEAPEFHQNYRPGVPKPEGPREQTAEERAAQKAELLARWDGTRKHPPHGA